ncbi:polysaccharide deacetylase family protein [Methyloversatilis sp.]|uniref:polysaccharide deacetylase family protein n=1 Tax=Methyloversatilis sp. TaxID=2569862 RepID=UPI0027347900|nr:polysaccharide deacetylase family protein [Methyloversatilis sp.]MDP2867648.1 polysaccharide deacetylase family protein [Methyloversatilis sp.]MDP3456696.1 polysaccharide deacetylase family protein [Methyloversatilis sp.]MDP3577212.1 polysaccharide deacetylase family protein [Methyloversatilis sp.]
MTARKQTAERIPVLMYHRVGDTSNAWEARYGIRPEDFRAHMQALADVGYRAVTIDDMVKWLEGDLTLPEGAFLLTFDDGFKGVMDHAMPVLQQLGWPATVFLVSDLIGSRDEWTRTSNPSGQTHPLLDADDIRTMSAAGFSFHSHTRSHASLPTLDDDALADQLAGSRRALQNLLGHDVDYIAYPFGHLDERVEVATRAAGYRVAFSTQPGFNRNDVNRLRIRRLDVFGTDTPAMLLRKVRLGSNDGTLGNAVRYYFRQITRRLPGASR